MLDYDLSSGVGWDSSKGFGVKQCSTVSHTLNFESIHPSNPIIFMNAVMPAL